MSGACIKGIRIVITVTVILLVGINAMPVELSVPLVVENGPVELLTAVGYFLVTLWLFALPYFQPGRKTISAGIMVLLLGLRELDFHSKFTTMGILKTRYYLSPDVPLPEKTIVSVIMLSLTVTVFMFLKVNWKKFIDGLKEQEACAVNVLLALVVAAGSKILDSNSASLHWLAALYHENPARSMQINEEVIELAVPLFLLCAVYHLTKNYKGAPSISA